MAHALALGGLDWHEVVFRCLTLDASHASCPLILTPIRVFPEVQVKAKVTAVLKRKAEQVSGVGTGTGN